MDNVIEKEGMLDGNKFYDSSQFNHGSLYLAKRLNTWAVYLCKEYVSGHYPANGNAIMNKGFFLIYPDRGGLSKSKPISVCNFTEIKSICDLNDLCN